MYDEKVRCYNVRIGLLSFITNEKISNQTFFFVKKDFSDRGTTKLPETWQTKWSISKKRLILLISN